VSIEVTGVSKRYGDFVALDDINVSLPTGQLTALLGPSGGGKSTLLRIIAGLETADTGTVSIEGTEATHLPPQKRNVGFVFQHYAVFKHMSVAKNVAFGLEIRRRPKAEIKQRVAELLELVHLSQFASPAASGSGWRSPGHSPWSRACSCSTSRSARSTRRCARSCATGCGGCTTRCT
jgi:sulfate/thiosulfate transport system ATP-binding protein